MKSILILALLIQLISQSTSLVCWYGTSSTYSSSIEAKNGNICIRYNYCPTGWNGTICSTTSTIYYDQMSILDSNNIAKSKDIIKCSTDYCNTLINPRTICYYGSSLNTYRREFDITSKSCYSYMYSCTVTNDFCLPSDIGKTRIAYGISNSITCEGVKDLVKCCQSNLCTRTIQPTSLACNIYFSMKLFIPILLLIILRDT